MLNLQNVANLSITEGNVRTIHDGNSNLLWGRLTYDTKYAGDSSQSGNPDPNNPLSISNVTGTQTVTVSDGTNSEAYTVNLGTIELCKIDNYQDYIYKSGNDWYIHKEVGKVILTGSADETWSGGNNNIYFFHVVAGAYQPENRSTFASILSDHFKVQTYNQVASTTIDYGIALDSNNAGRLAIRNKDIADTSALKTWLASNNTTVYYALATSTDTKITDNTLIGQLEAIHHFLTRYGYSSSVSGNLSIIINQTTLS